ncbi:MAG: hypothetical protein ABH800_01970 [Candidatus Nealsonbacteria bacterium]
MAHKRKIFDINPPKEKEYYIEKELEQKEPYLKEEAKPAPVKKQRAKRNFSLNKKLIFVAVFLFLVGCLSYFFIKPKAELAVWPEQEVLSFDAQLTVDSSINETDFKSGIVPGEIVRKEKTVSQEFSSTGIKSKAEKAHGTIRVYNAYSTYSQVLVATTRFVSDDGKLFRIAERVVIPGGYYEGGKLVPGTVDIEVFADQSGEEYNIGPSTFSIPGFAGTPKYTAFYAKSSESMEGGSKAEIPEVSAGDLKTAEEILTEKALKESRESLIYSISSLDRIVLDETIIEKIIEVLPLAKEGQAADRFLFQVKAETKALVFNKEDLEEFAKNYILSQISFPEQDLYEKSLVVNYSLNDVNLDGNKAVLDIEMSVKIYSTVDQNSVKDKVKNKTEEEIAASLADYPEIEKAQIKLWPFWVKRSPSDKERIEVSLILD